MAENYKVVENIKVYDIDYLLTHTFTDEDINILLENNSRNFTFSLIVAMYRYVKSNKKTKHIIGDCRANQNWLNECVWSEKSRGKFENKVADIYKNIFRYNDQVSKQKAEWFTTCYGFVTNEAIKLRKK